MPASLASLSSLLSLALWAGLWISGGCWTARAAFNLRREEQVLAGFAAGMLLENNFASLLARWLPIPLAFWLAAALVALLGLLLALRGGWRSLYRIPILPGQWLAVGLLALFLFALNQGFALFDDFAHLPTLSLMAAGDFPPHFALDPAVPYDYHYYLMVFAAQLMRLKGFFPWKALDLARGLSGALAFALMYLWVRRLTWSRLAGVMGSLFLAFATGTRWLLLLLPENWLARVSENVHMIGSGLQSGPVLTAALTGNWVIEGGGPLGFPFAFVNGIQKPGIFDLMGVNGLAGTVLALLILLTFNRWRGWRGPLVTALLLPAGALLGEVSFVSLAATWGILALIWAARHKTLRLPANLWIWLGVIAASRLLGLLMGGAVSGALAGALQESATGVEAASYQTIAFRLVWPPQLVSAHLGVLSLTNFWQALAALCEIGPILLVLPLLVIYGLKAFRAGRWYEAAIPLGALLSTASIFFEFSGSTGVRNTTRLYSFIDPCVLFAVPLVWRVFMRRSQRVKGGAAVYLGSMMFGGAVLFGIMLPAVQRPVETYFIDNLDMQAARDYWNRLEPGAKIFDPDVSRAPTVFGRPTDSSLSWYQYKPEWTALSGNPDPLALHAYGFDYAYLDNGYLDRQPLALQTALTSGCSRVVQKYEDWKHDTRLLVDLRGCR